MDKKQIKSLASQALEESRIEMVYHHFLYYGDKPFG